MISLCSLSLSLFLKTTCGVLFVVSNTNKNKGSNVKKIGTVATYDALSREFVIATPNSAAQKFCIVNGTLATHAVVFAQLIVSEQNVYMTPPHLEIFLSLYTSHTLYTPHYTIHSTLRSTYCNTHSTYFLLSTHTTYITCHTLTHSTLRSTHYTTHFTHSLHHTHVTHMTYPHIESVSKALSTHHTYSTLYTHHTLCYTLYTTLCTLHTKLI